MTEQTIDTLVTDTSIIQRIVSGDEAALAMLYDRHHLVALRVAMRLVRDQGRAEDVVQEAFLSVWRKAGSYLQGRGSVKSWLLGIVRNGAIDTLRTQRDSGADDEAALLSLRDSSPAVFDQVVARLDGEIVRCAVSQLPPLQRDAITTAYFDGRSHAEIAHVTGYPLGTVHGRIRLGLGRLRTQLMSVGIEAPAAG